MTRREMRDHTFKMLFLQSFYEEAELEEQCRLYMEEYTSIEEEARQSLTARSVTIAARVAELDDKINEAAKGWRTSRMNRADLTILRLALYEMLYDESVPVKVAINEAVELAKKYGGDDSPSFVNGILARLVKNLELKDE